MEVDNDQLRAVIEAAALIQEVAKELDIDHSTVIWHLKHTAKVTKLSTHELTANFKNCHFEVSSSFIIHKDNK